MTRPLHEIADDIIADHRANSKRTGKPVPDYIRAYIAPMRYLKTLDESFGYDDAETVVIYALSNLTYWRGETARKCKRELQEMLHTYNPRRYKAPK